MAINEENNTEELVVESAEEALAKFVSAYKESDAFKNLKRADEVFSDKMKTWNDDFFITLSIFRNLLGEHVLSLSDGNKNLQRMTDVKFVSFFYPSTQFGKEDIYSDKFKALLETNDDLKDLYTSRLKNLKVLDHDEVSSRDIAKNILNSADECLKEHKDSKIDVNLYFDAVYKFNPKQREDLLTNPPSSLVICSSFRTNLVTMQCGYDPKVSLSADVMKEVDSDAYEILLHAFKEHFDNIIKNDEDYKVVRLDEVYAYGALYAMLELTDVTSTSSFKKVFGFTPSSNLSDLLGSEELFRLAIENIYICDDMIADGEETLRVIKETTTRIERRITSSSSSSSSSSSDDGWTVGEVIGAIVGLGALAYAGGVAYSYFSSDGTIGDAIDTVNHNILDTLGLGDGIKVIK